MNLLILSVGTRNKIVQYFKKEISGKGQVIATDASELAPALYEADKYYVVPKIDADDYLFTIKKICTDNNINVVLSLIDPELNILAKNSQMFIDIGVIPIISDIDVVDLCYNKFLFNQKLKNLGFKTIKSYVDKNIFYNDLANGKISFPVFIKPICGSASLNVSKVSCVEDLEFIFSKNKNMMIQEFMNGKEYGVDAYIDIISNNVSAIFIKQKIQMRAGETDKSISTHNDILKNLVFELIGFLRLRGVIDIDIFEVNGDFYISEINPRFGGGYPHAYECGVNIPKMILNNINGFKNTELEDYENDIYMLKFNDVKIVKNGVINNGS